MDGVGCRMIRWCNAIFRLLWLEACEYDSQINNTVEVMTGNLGPLLTQKEWDRIKDGAGYAYKCVVLLWPSWRAFHFYTYKSIS